MDCDGRGGVAHHLHLRAERQHLHPLAGRAVCEATCAASRLARASRSPARMLNELSMASTVSLDRRPMPPAVIARYGRAKASASSSDQRRAQREQQQVPQAPVLDGALRAPLEKHQRAEGQRRGFVLAQQVQPDGQAHRQRSRQNHGARNPILHPPLPHGQILAQAFVQRTAGVHQEIIQARAFGLVAQRLDVRVDLAAVFVARVFRRNFQMCRWFPCPSAAPARGIWARSPADRARGTASLRCRGSAAARRS